MTVLENQVRIEAPPERVWSVLASLDALANYDPGISKSEIVSEAKQGPGAARKCDLAPGGWFKERVAAWRPNEALSFELYECTLPVRALRHSYTLVPDAGGTVVRQRMEYRLKFGPLGEAPRRAGRPEEVGRWHPRVLHRPQAPSRVAGVRALVRSIEPVRLDRRQQIEGIAVVRDDARPAAPFATRLLPDPQKAHAPSTRRGTAGKRSRGLTVVGARGFEPPTFRSRNGEGPSQGAPTVDNPAQSLQTEGGVESSQSQGLGGFTKDFSTRFLPNSSAHARTAARTPAAGGRGV